ncbi:MULTISPECIES: hypothetical protein [unclassified Streptomyces]|uniref:hypothetical protein n=1 Tax=unclassified Streptomyces TaxID=2593676 RepID=UPI0022539527|nr:hypothetical protein [Streptomyces sp. NBC_00268]MCX5183021.1 hypothetical protein [Streptomyces sp. NBC_00268]
MAKSTWDAMRAAVARLFRRGGEESAAQDLRLIDAARQRLVDSSESERGSMEDRLRTELMIQLAAFLQKYPDAAQDLQDLVDQVKEANSGGGARTSVHGNTSSQVVISGGDINASGGFHYRAPEQSR